MPFTDPRFEELLNQSFSNAQSRRSNELAKRAANKIFDRYKRIANTDRTGKRGFIH